MADWKRIKAAVDGLWNEGASAEALAKSYFEASEDHSRPSWCYVMSSLVERLNASIDAVQVAVHQEQEQDHARGTQ